MDLIEQKPAVVTLPHPFSASNKQVYVAEFMRGETLGAYIRRNGVNVPRLAFKVWHNARPVPMSLWDRLIPKQGDQIIIRAVGQGGGGGSKVLRTVAMIALVVGTYGVGSWAGFGAALAEGTGLALGTAQGLMMFGGALMITPLLPPVQPRNEK
ncbi:MAG TPA: hypothetical protein DIS96_03750 [Pusillimonas sp.]|nr:hypothetical protein [Pusillimonas sp.]